MEGSRKSRKINLCVNRPRRWKWKNNIIFWKSTVLNGDTGHGGSGSGNK